MTSKTSTSNDEEEDDYVSFVPWLDLIFEVDNTSTDLILSTEELLTERYLKAGTLPAILRRLTFIETTSQSQIYALLLHLRLFVTPRYVFTFLMKRFHLTPHEVDEYASNLRNEIGTILDHEDSSDIDAGENLLSTEQWSSTGPYGPQILEENRHVIGPQYFWLATSSELSLHSDDLSKRSMALFCDREDMDRLMLESYSSIQLGVLIFLETWLQHFPEDFLLATARVNSKFTKNLTKSIQSTSEFEYIREFPLSPNPRDREREREREEDGGGGGGNPYPSSKWVDDSDDTFIISNLITFLREFSSSMIFYFLGGRITKFQEKSPTEASSHKRGFSHPELTSITIPHSSQLKIQFPCISNILEVILGDDSLNSIVKQVISLPSPPSHENISETNNRQSMRVSFFEKFIDSRLSEILEFEDEGDMNVAATTETDGENPVDFATKLLTSSLGPEERLSNGCADTENFPVVIPCEGGILNCIISSSLVSAQTAAAIELRSKSPLISISHSQCQVSLEQKWKSDELFMIDTHLTEDGKEEPILAPQMLLDDSEESGFSSPGKIQLSQPPSSQSSPSIPLSLLGKITQGLQIQREKSMVDMYVAYSECAITLCAVELKIAQDYAMSDSVGEVPVRIFSTTIDRQIIGFSGSKKKGLDQIANLLRLHRSPTTEIDPLTDQDSSSDSKLNTNRQRSGTNSPRKSIFSFMRRRSLDPTDETRLSTSSTTTTTTTSSPTPSPVTRGSQSLKSSHLSHISPDLISQSLFLSHDDITIANNLTLRFHYLLCTIPFYEFSFDYSYSKNLKETPMLNRFRHESEKLQEFIGNEILIQTDLMIRAEVIIQIIRVAEILARLRSHHVLMMVVFALQNHSIHRLKTTWAVVHTRLPGRWDILQDLVGFGGQKLTSNFCCRQSVEGVSDDIRDHLKLTIPSSLPLSDSLISFLDSKDVKTLQINENSEGKSLSFGGLASKEAYPTKGGLTHPNTTLPSSSSSSLLTIQIPSNRSCSNSDLQNSLQNSSSFTSPSSHWIRSLQDPLIANNNSKSSSSALLHRSHINHKRQFPRPEVMKLKPKFVLKRRFSYPLTKKDLTQIQHAINCYEIVHLTRKESDVPSGEEDQPQSQRSVSTNTHNLSHVFGPPGNINNSNSNNSGGSGSSHLRRLRTQSDVPPQSHSHNLHSHLHSQVSPVDVSMEGSNIKVENSSLYRQHLLQKSISENKPVYGTVRSDGLGEAGGTPKPSGKPCLPYINGILGRIIRLKEIPPFIKTEIRQSDGQPVSCYYSAQSPGNSKSDPHMLLINFGKLRAISNLLILLRSSQMTPYKFEINFDIQYLCGKACRYHGEDAMWERSKALE